MNLIDVYSRPDRATSLYKLLAERDETINISHKGMPCLADHVAFIESRPYQAWYFIENNDYELDIVGACYLTKQNEIGVFVFREYRGLGFGPKAVEAIIAEHGPGRYLANINPKNYVSAAVFQDLGFKLAQHTYELTA